ncbi:alpha/beta fold hydrolase [Pseudonocardia sp. HH130630-07]|uniref:alpha/beta fold hydrolase n=1 Tax=Pseudonocardia sp. HH130630-07 TaxID=1690815 RepID=UPI0008150420|nr:alpha/beta hydrolase [Pseudonocardia sp. HH130630-07]ANY08179.1 hypothetical protein AFB00_19975 [Pseudonocardia sp. HH130630-07]
MTTRTLTVPIPDGHLAVVDTGAGHPVVLLHGGVLDHRMWEPQITPLAQEYRVIAPDLRGHGRASTPVVPFRHGDDVAALLRALDLGPATLVGISLGAGTATDTALDHPDVVDSLVLSGAGSSVPDFRDPWTTELLADWAAAERNRDAARWLEIFLRIGIGPYREVADVDPTVTNAIRAIATDTLTRHVPDGSPVLPTPGDRPLERATTLRVPVRAVIGTLDSDDHIRMPREIAEAAGGDVIEIPGAAHYPNLEQPEAFTATVLDFLRGQRRHRHAR